jgi:hypothetical protein
MSFLKRVLAPTAALNWFDLPATDAYGITVEQTDRHSPPFPWKKHGDADQYDATATFQREAREVRVLVNGTKVGYLPAGIAPAWNRYLARLEQEGFRARVQARVAVGNQRFWVTLETDSHTPDEIAERAAWEAAGLCPKCGAAVDRSKNKARRLCTTCRPATTSGAASS